MTKYGWRRFAMNEGYSASVVSLDDDLWFGEMGNSKHGYSGFWDSELAAEKALEAWWRENNSQP